MCILGVSFSFKCEYEIRMTTIVFDLMKSLRAIFSAGIDI